MNMDARPVPGDRNDFTQSTDPMHQSTSFSYEAAFSRNIGWLTTTEQQAIRKRRIAIAGMGGVGGVHLLTLARLGVGSFSLADFDTFALPNFNRQAGASMSTLDTSKLASMAAMASDINPELELRLFDDGVTSGNINQFLEGVDLYVDGLDFFAFEARSMVFAECAKRKIPAITAAPIGMGAAVLVFAPGGMSFEDYFAWSGQDENEKALRFVVGLTPTAPHRPYLVDPTAVNLSEHRTPSTIMACQMCAGMAATEALKILLKRGPVRSAPHATHFDAYRQKLVKTWRPWGNRNPLQRLILAVARKQFAAMQMRNNRTP